MKTKSVRVLGLTFILSLLISLIFIYMPNKKIYSQATGLENGNYYMWNKEQGKPELDPSVTNCGSLFINGKEVQSEDSVQFVLGEKNVTVVASANQGYTLVGWYILYEDDKLGYISGTTEGYIKITDNDQNLIETTDEQENISYLLTIKPFSVDNKQASFVINEVFENIKIAPVYDFEYFNVTITDTEKRVIREKNCKYGDVVEYTQDIENVKIDATGFTFSNNSIEYTHSFTKDEITGKTTQYQLNFTMSVYEDVNIVLNYDELYQIDFQLYLEESELNSNEQAYNDILSCLNIKADKVWDSTAQAYVDKYRYFKKLSNTSYLVKANNNFEISVDADIRNANNCVIYKLYSLDGSLSNLVANYNKINQDKVVKIVYRYKTYGVEFVGVELLQDNSVQTDSSLEVPLNVSNLTISNNSLDLTSAGVENIGYNFLGFAKVKESGEIYTDDDYINSISLSVERPTNLKVYAIYQKIEYTFNLTNLTSVNLTNLKGEDVYPISNATLNNETKSGTSITFDTTYKIGDSLTLKLYVNNGFIVESVDGLTKAEEENVFTLTLDKAFLNGKSANIDLKLNASVKKYSLTYRIDRLEDDSKMADISIKDVEILAQTSEDEQYYEIVVEDLTYYQTLTLNSTAKNTGEEGEYYQFRWFTTDFKTTLSGVTYNDSTPPTMSVDFVIYADSVVYVVYTHPMTQLKIEINSAPENADISFEVTQAETEGVLEEKNGLYSLTQSKLVSINISNLESNSNLFGYNFVNIELYTLNLATGNRTKVINSESTSTSLYTFTPTTSDVYVLVVNIEKVNYIFNISSNLEFEKTITLTVEDSLIEFEKPTGYYVGKVQILSIGGDYESYAIMEQNNSSRNGQIVNGKDLFSIYTYEISTTKLDGQISEFEQLILNYGIQQGNDITVDINLTFNIYMYEVRLKYYKFYNDENNTTSGIKLVYPTINLTYSVNGTTNNADQEYLNSEILYKNIPYNANATLTVEQLASYGFAMRGWYDYDCVTPKYSTGVNEEDRLLKFNLPSLTADDRLSYRVDFNKYRIELVYNQSMGEAKVNNEDSLDVKMGDSIEIKANPSLAKGFIAKSIKTQKYVYTDYTYTTDEQFALDCENLVIIKSGYIYSLLNKEYNPEYSYYTISITEEEVVADNYKNSRFDVGEYYADTNNVITFEITYVPVEMTISNVSTLVAKLGVNDEEVCEKLDIDKIGLTIDQIATYSVKATRAGATREIVENETVVTVDDIITVDIQINQSAQTSNNKTFNLADGLELNYYLLSRNWVDLKYENKGNGAYQISFVVSKNLKMSFINSGVIEISFAYQQQKLRTVSVTTNMAGSTQFVSATELGIIIDGNETNSNNVGLISRDDSFLSSATVDLDLKGLNNYFVINSITVYAGANIISNLEEYFITPNYTVVAGSDRRVVTNVELILTDVDITIQFNVQPRIYLEGVEITTQPVYIFNRTYAIDEQGNGVAQEFSLGSKLTNDISGYEIDSTVMKVEIYKNGIKQPDGAINVGEYTLKLALVDEENTSSWLYYVKELPFVIKVNVSPLNIRLEAEVKSQIVKEYNVESLIAISFVKVGNKLQTSNGEIEIYGIANQKQFNLGMLIFDSNYSAEVVLYGEDSGLVSQKNVTSNAHLLITNLALKNSPNFTLLLNDYTLNSQEAVKGLLVESCVKITPKVIEIANLEVYDKVWDGESKANFGLIEGQTKYILAQTYTADDVYLIAEELKIYFTTRAISINDNILDIQTSDIGADRYIVIDARTALGGNQRNNYVIGTNRTNIINYNKTASIYPYTISTTVKGIGNVTITNKRGLTDHTKANLIPINSTLNVERFDANSAEYRDIHSKISSYLSRRNVFVAGYKLSLIDRNGTKTNVSNELYLTLPGEEELKQVLSVSGDRTVGVDYSEKSGNIEIDLKQVNEDISYFVLIQNRALLKTWQIVLIVVISIVVLAGAGVAVFFIVRKRNLRNDKYDTI